MTRSQNMSKFSFAFSPCPNDTFMFEAIFNNRIDLRGYKFDIHLDDVSQLNRSAVKGQFDISKISYSAYSLVSHQYQLLNSGSALGHNCGPLLIAKSKIDGKDIKNCSVAIPGANTTANLLLSLAFPDLSNKKEYIFSEIEDAIVKGDVDLGLIIHENRFTYEKRGLVKIQDLGEYWESTTKCPIPLGGIAVKRLLPQSVKEDIEAILKDSIQFAFSNKEKVQAYVASHSQEMNEKVMQSHIDLYVNQQSILLDALAKQGIELLIEEIKYLYPGRIIQYPIFI